MMSANILGDNNKASIEHNDNNKESQMFPVYYCEVFINALSNSANEEFWWVKFTYENESQKIAHIWVELLHVRTNCRHQHFFLGFADTVLLYGFSPDLDFRKPSW
jgi:hypothetical protein